MRLVILTGASGSGKTAIAKAIGSRRPELAEVMHFDSIGVPSVEERRAWGPDGAWQRAMTLDWMARIAARDQPDRAVLFEGQMRLAFIWEGLRAAGIAGACVILVDCDDATRTRRLIVNRGQPELANPEMMMWAAYLRREAEAAGCDVLDTSQLPLEQCVERVGVHLVAADP